MGEGCDGGGIHEVLIQEACLILSRQATHEVFVMLGYNPFLGEVGRTMRGVAALDCARE